MLTPGGFVIIKRIIIIIIIIVVQTWFHMENEPYEKCSTERVGKLRMARSWLYRSRLNAESSNYSQCLRDNKLKKASQCVRLENGAIADLLVNHENLLSKLNTRSSSSSTSRLPDAWLTRFGALLIQLG